MSRGQSMVEFALVMPIVLVLLLTVADFARYFAAGITVESAARAAAETVAQNYLANPPGPLSSPAPTPGSPPYYTALHQIAASTVCGEMQSLPNSGAPGSGCSGIAVLVCVHDNADSVCDAEPSGHTIDGNCDQLSSYPTNTQAGVTETSRYVEVRVCYRFSTIMGVSGIPSVGQVIPVLTGDFYIQRTRMFTIADY